MNFWQCWIFLNGLLERKESVVADMTLAEEIHDVFLDATSSKPFGVDAINEILERRLYGLLSQADGALSAIRHGRQLEDRS